MTSDALRVTTAHLRELAAAHHRAVAEMVIGTDLVAGATDRVLASHGSIAAPTAGVLRSIERIRRVAGESLAQNSRALSDDLSWAARRYDATDSASGSRIDGSAL